jgi:hypothetical protein
LCIRLDFVISPSPRLNEKEITGLTSSSNATTVKSEVSPSLEVHEKEGAGIWMIFEERVV